MNKKTKVKKRKVVLTSEGIVNIKATSNNTICTITNPAGQVICWGSAGLLGFKGPKKSTPFAAKEISKRCAKEAYNLGMRKVEVRVRGIGTGREHAIRALGEVGMKVGLIQDFTPVPHNGCRAPKIRHK